MGHDILRFNTSGIEEGGSGTLLALSKSEGIRSVNSPNLHKEMSQLFHKWPQNIGKPEEWMKKKTLLI